MRLDVLRLTRYGRFTDTQLYFAPPAAGATDLHIVYGPNEAGKSTLFSAWLDLLYGIPLRSRYDYLHPGPTMRIGARISQNGQTLDLTRIKRNSGSLLDAHAQPIPEAQLQAVLGGLSRDGYSAMFSLDDDTLETGGDSILASRGDLGEMLFSASAGLADLSPRLETIRAGLDGFHRSGKRSGWLHDAKKELQRLDDDRKRIEVSASRLRKLVSEARAAEQALREARAAEVAAQAKVSRLQDLAATMPLRARRDELELALAPLAGLPPADPALRDRLSELEREVATLRGGLTDRQSRLARLHAQAADLPADPAVLACAEAIAAAEALRPEHDTALRDLPRRHEEADRIRGRIAARLAELGCPDAAAAGVVLPAARLSALRALVTRHAGLLATAAAAEDERRKTAALLARERDRLGDLAAPGDDRTLQTLLDRLRAQDPALARARALRDRDHARNRLAEAIEALAPWTGDGDRLAALAVPPGWQIAAWQADLETARQEAADARRASDALREDLNRLAAEAATEGGAQRAAGLSLADAAAARSRREVLWAAHLDSLDRAGALAFEQALREDDRISALLAETMAEARRVALTQTEAARLAQRLAEAEARQRGAALAQAAIRSAIEAAGAGLGVSGGLPELVRWLDLRLEALTQRSALRDAETDLARSEDALAAAGLALAAALGCPDGAAAPPYETLLAEAVARVEAAERRREARRHLAALATELRERDAAVTDAGEALARWQDQWAEASRDTLLSDPPPAGPVADGVLDNLAELGSLVRELEGLDDRIAKMAANRDRFVTAKAAILAALDLAPATGWDAVQARLRRARDAARDGERLAAEIAGDRSQIETDRRRLNDAQREIAALGAALGWTEADGSLAAHVGSCLEAAGLRQEIARLTAQIQNRPEPGETDTAVTIPSQIAGLEAELTLLRAASDTRLEAWKEAERQVEAVGGDDALARIAAERANLLLEIEDRVRRHLAARFGLIAFEAGLRRYRDRHRSAMLARASDAFSRLSRGAYAGLASQPDGAQEVLVALPAGGGARLATDLSKGTRFQLYLALRVAGFHELAQGRPGVPFIADDIMETFDDDRSAAAFHLLGEMSRVGQVIYLTHHRHLCDIARATCPGAHVIDLQSH